jgi:phosphoribosylformylglycinamidine synthase
VSLIVTAFATLDDVRGTLTPQLQPGDTTLILVDLGQGRMRMGGSMLAQVLGSSATRCPTWTMRSSSRSLVAAINALRAQGRCWPTTTAATAACGRRACEMAFAGHLGVSLNVDILVTEGDGIADSRAEYGDSKNWATQVGERRNELTLRALFNEELGVVLQVPTAERNEVMATLREHGLSRHAHFIGKTNSAA